MSNMVNKGASAACLAAGAASRALSTHAGAVVGHSGHLSSDALRNRHDSPKVEGAGLSPTAKYMFDLNGFLVLRNVLSPEMIAAANAAIDKHEATELHERAGQLRTSALYGRESEALKGDGKTGRKDMGGMLGWPKPDCDPFRDVLAHPEISPALIELLGVGYRLDHSPLLISQEKGAEGHTLHGGAVTEAGEPAWTLAYDFRNGQMRNQLLTVCMQLRDAGPGDGGFCVVPGSHKSNYPVPPAMADLAEPELNAFVQQPELYPGDVLIFTEAVLHGTLPWTADHTRRTVIYRFAPAGTAYGRGYYPEWPASAYEGATEAQKAVLQPPFHPRMNRAWVDEKGQAKKAATREAFKVEFDEKVFGSRYF